MHRRHFIQNASVAGLGAVMPAFPGFLQDVPELRLGVAEASYMMRAYRNIPSEAFPPFKGAMDMLEHCASLGFGGVQVSIGKWDTDYAKTMRKRNDKLGLFLEGSVRLPQDESDLERFESEVTAAAHIGIDVIRTLCLSGRRYETFKSAEAFAEFRKNSEAALRRAEPIIRKHRVKLAVENHKDWTIAEFKEILNSLGSEWVGITLDTGNNISLLEDPMEVVRELAPYAFSVHLKDMAVAPYADGFLLSEVNLGMGYLDIEEMVRVIRREQPEIRFNLEMITRDPLLVPCLTPQYWETQPKVTAGELAHYMEGIRNMKKMSLPVISDFPQDEQLRLEVENNRTCLNTAQARYGFA
ncbi:sugar phosphate isomerase/epimerase [Robiginitalea sp.]|nr:sugar phosphate isomerase/epimerase [Robiginitalea sp.]